MDNIFVGLIFHPIKINVQSTFLPYNDFREAAEKIPGGSLYLGAFSHEVLIPPSFAAKVTYTNL